VHVPEVSFAGIVQVRPEQQSLVTVQPVWSCARHATHTCAVGSQIVEQHSAFEVHDWVSGVHPVLQKPPSHKPVQHSLELLQ
jgi:hypothetical protein